MSNAVSLSRHDEIGVITVDNPPVNAISHAVRSGIVEKLAEANNDDSIKAIVLNCAGRTFIAGADITEFGKPIAEPGLNAVVNALENSSKLVVAALHGTALGGGLEVALGCHYRIAVPSAKVGLPEVKLGLLPGAGGTQRLPRLIGIAPALAMIVSGNPVPASIACDQRTIDRLASGDLLADAIEYTRDLLSSRAPLRKISEMDTDEAEVDEDFYDQFRASIAKKARGYFAPEQIIKAVQAANLPFEQGLARERELFIECMQSPESAAQRYLFFAERHASKIPDIPRDTPVREIKKIAVIGAGTMGGGIAMNFTNIGIPVKVVEVNAEAIERGLAQVRKNYARGVKKGRMTEEQLEQMMNLYTPVTDYDDLNDVDLVIEAVFENMDLKKEIFRKLDRVCKPGAILATNTSTLDVDEIAAVTERPDDVIGLHFFSPANIMRLLEIVRGEQTSKEVLNTCIKLAKKIKKVGVVSGVCDGFIGNRMLEGYGRETGLMLLEGASIEQIDKVIFDFGMPMGPLTMNDLAGIDVGAKIRVERRAAGRMPDDERFGLIADKLVEQGRLGQKTSAGFYKYEPGSRAPTPDLAVGAMIREEAARLGIEQRDISDEEIVSRCIYPLINEGARILQEGIALRASDIDIVWTNGYGFPPYRGGPMFYADTVGIKKVYDTICHFRNTLDDRFGYWEPAPLLEKLARTGKTFAEY
ncbi:MAG: 3-hydroxyacyl-CoA dehydrogenase NAD-binding domain-containing protein [Gammaproteobacteria bacterium]|nr:3-hydroxyacyl-CoA dehydrogenase NAD-binding domain-containing protein [Gammaproteobacteria bacterium]